MRRKLKTLDFTNFLRKSNDTKKNKVIKIMKMGI